MAKMMSMKMTPKTYYYMGGALILILLIVVFKDAIKDFYLKISGKLDTDEAKLNKDLILKNGSMGPEVAELQRRIIADGAVIGNVDGRFGPKTETGLETVKGVKQISLNQYDITNKAVITMPETATEFVDAPTPGAGNY